MKSELYHTIYKIAIFCVAAALGLTFGAAGLSVKVGNAAAAREGVAILTWATTAFGGLLCIISIGVAVHFRKCYNEAKMQEEATSADAKMQLEAETFNTDGINAETTSADAKMQLEAETTSAETINAEEPSAETKMQINAETASAETKM